MTSHDISASGRSRRRKAGFAPSLRAPSKTPVLTRVWLLLVPALLAGVHLTSGANEWVAGQWMAAASALALLIAMATPLRRGAADMRPTAPLAILFGLTLLTALWTLTPWAPGGPHPIWAWAEVSPGSTTVNRTNTILEIVKLMGLGCVFAVGALQGWRRNQGQATADGVLWVGAAYAAVSLMIFGAMSQSLPGTRLTGGFLSSNTGATVFGVLTVLGLGAVLRGLKTGSGEGLAERLPAITIPAACLLLCGLCLVLTASRAGAASTAAAAAVLLVWHAMENRTQRWTVALLGLVMIAAALALLLMGRGDMFGRLDGVGADVAFRAPIMEAHWQAFLASPMLGYGLGSFEAINQQLMTAANVDVLWNVRATHNVYLQWLEEAGLVGALPMFALIGVILVCAIRRSFRLRTGRTQHHALVAANLVVLIHGAFDFGLQVPSVAAFWAFLLGLQFAFGQDRS